MNEKQREWTEELVRADVKRLIMKHGPKGRAGLLAPMLAEAMIAACVATGQPKGDVIEAIDKMWDSIVEARKRVTQ